MLVFFTAGGRVGTGQRQGASSADTEREGE